MQSLARWVVLCGAGILLLEQPVFAEVPLGSPESVGMDTQRLAAIDPLVKKAIDAKRLPGCVVAIGHRGKLVYLRAFGNRRVEPDKEAMSTETVFDMASLTKPVATATSIMMLVEDGRVRIRNRVRDYLPEFGNQGKEAITIKDLLLHQGGLIPDNALRDYEDGPEKAIERIHQLKLSYPVRERFRYTDVGFIVLAEVVKRVTGMDVHEFSQKRIFEPLGMKETGYKPAKDLRARAAPTEQREGRWMQGEVHDPRAYRLGGIAGHAGLFSTATDMARYAQMMINGGTYQGRRILSKRTVEVMTANYQVSSGKRGLGWDKLSGYSSNRGELMTPTAFGHGGFTGTAMWVDPQLDLFVIFLSNRVHPNGKGSVNSLAGAIGTIACAAIDSAPAAKASTKGRVLSGADVLATKGFKLLKGKRVGLITNQTGRLRNGMTTAQALHKSPEVNLKALFSPEHGLEGKLDVPKIDDTKDEKTGVKVYSLYGKTRIPTPESLATIDVLVFDIQDIGTRFYTYISTMGNAMKAAADQGVEFMVLDRPNPIGGLVVDGPILDKGKESFVGFHTIPVRHGMTIGELARMFQAELNLDLNLTVVPVEGWSRSKYYDECDLAWVNPSPNMRNLNQAILYPGVGLLETTNLSVGRGTDTPFEIVGAPWLNGRKLATALNGVGLPGIRFTAIHFKPESSVYSGVECEGIRMLITDRDAVDSLRVGFEIAAHLRRDFREHWKVERYARLLGSDRVLKKLSDGGTAISLMNSYQSELASFRSRRAQFLIYR